MTELEMLKVAKGLIEGRLAMSQKTAAIHPDLLTRVIAAARVESFRLALADIESAEARAKAAAS